jgi:hypothetical protein
MLASRICFGILVVLTVIVASLVFKCDIFKSQLS